MFTVAVLNLCLPGIKRILNFSLWLSIKIFKISLACTIYLQNSFLQARRSIEIFSLVVLTANIYLPSEGISVCTNFRDSTKWELQSKKLTF